MRPRASSSPPLPIRLLFDDAAFSPDVARILTASADNSAKLWDAASGKLIASFDHQDVVHDAAFSPDGTRILTASPDNTPSSGMRPRASSSPPLPIRIGSIEAAFSPDSSRILTASADKTAKLWDAASGKLIASFAHQASVDRRGV